MMQMNRNAKCNAVSAMRVARESTHSHTKDSKYRKSICYLIATQCVITNAYIIQFGRSNSNTHIRKNNATLFGIWHYLLPLFTKCTLIFVPLHLWILESISLAKSSATLCTVAICLEMEMAGAFFGGSTIFISIQWRNVIRLWCDKWILSTKISSFIYGILFIFKSNNLKWFSD